MAAEGMPFPWPWNGGTISKVLDGIWGMSDSKTYCFLYPVPRRIVPNTEPMFPLPESATWANDFRTRGAGACW